jgi:hypothetical protein
MRLVGSDGAKLEPDIYLLQSSQLYTILQSMSKAEITACALVMVTSTSTQWNLLQATLLNLQFLFLDLFKAGISQHAQHDPLSVLLTALSTLGP